MADRETSIGARFAEIAATQPDRPAVRFGDAEMSYAELDAAANRVADAVLEELGEHEEPVGVLAGPGCTFPPVLIGLFKAGKVISPLDPEMPAAALGAILEASGSRLLLVDSAERMELARRVAGTAMVLRLDQVGTSPVGPPGVEVRPGAGALLFFTSGSTGRPKGVVQSHRMQLHHSLTMNRRLELAPGQTVAQLLSPSFAGAYISLHGALLSGAALSIFDLRGEGFAPVPGWLADEEAVMTGIVPTMLRPLTRAARDRPIEPLRSLVMMGERVTPEHVRSAQSIVARGGTVTNLYGATEAQVIATHDIPADEPFSDPDVPLGRPHAGARLRLAGPTPDGGADGGEIEVIGRYLARGYWRDAAASAPAFSSIGDDGEWVYRTGDRARLDGGRLYHAGRGDRRVKVRGHPVEIDAVERALRDLDGVRDAAVVDRPQEHGGSALDAYLAVEGGGVTETSLRAELRTRVPDQMVPWRLTLLDALPVLSSGKLDRQSLVDRAPEDATGDGPVERGSVEQVLQALWREILGVRAVGADDDFFELGGDSLKGAELIIAIEETLGRRLPVSALVRVSTISGLAEMIRTVEESGGPGPVAVTAQRGTRPPLFFCPGLLGSAFELRDLGAALGADRPLCGFDSPVWSADGSRWSVEAIAHQHVREIRTMQPEGPYLLGGYSFGGLVALEIARALEAAGERVTALVVAGTRLPPFDRSAPRFPGPAVLRPAPGASVRDRIAFHGRHVVSASAREVAGNLLRRTGMARAVDRAVWRHDLAVRGRVRARWRASYVWATTLEAAQRFEPRPYPGRVTLLRPEDYDPADLARWKQLAAGGVGVHDIRSTHEDLLREPAAVGATAQLLRCLPDAAGDETATGRAGDAEENRGRAPGGRAA